MAPLIPPGLLPGPPPPLPPQVRIVTNEGKPTVDYLSYLTKRYEWEKKLRDLLTQDPPPGP
jgi:hypothetical protein